VSYDRNFLITGSPIDNFVYATVNYNEKLSSGALTEQESFTWWLTCQLLFKIIQDSFSSDLIFLLPLKDREDDYYGAIDSLYPDVLELLGINDYVVLNGTDEQDADLCAKMIRLHQEAEVDASDRSGEDREGTVSLLQVDEEESSRQGLAEDTTDVSDNG